MRPAVQRTAHDWFQEAARYYVEGHQACAWCGGSHRVFKTLRGSRLEYHCNDCDFYVSHDQNGDNYRAELGLESAHNAEHCELESQLSGHGCFGIG